jgi:hypothetical protein
MNLENNLIPSTISREDAVELALLNMGPCEQCGEKIPFTKCLICHQIICKNCCGNPTENGNLRCKECLQK